jgi:hypothetical protein
MKTFDNILREATQSRAAIQAKVLGSRPFVRVNAEDIREMYINNEIYNVGDKIQVIESGVVGTIIRRGTNYLICVTEDNVMFKPWLNSVKEWTEVSGVPADQREVGTDSLRKYVMKLTGVKDIKNFIQKYKKK